jgi:hypothetical protein
MIKLHWWNKDILTMDSRRLFDYITSIPESKMEDFAMEVINNQDKSKHKRPSIIHTYSPCMVSVYRMLIAEGKLPLRDFELWMDNDTMLEVDEDGNILNYPQEMRIEFDIIARHTKAVMKKRGAK